MAGQNRIDSDAVMLTTRIPEGRKVRGLRYGACLTGIGGQGDGYYVTLDGEAWGVARLTPADDELPDADEDETQDEAIVRAVTEEIDASPKVRNARLLCAHCATSCNVGGAFDHGGTCPTCRGLTCRVCAGGWCS